MSPAKATRSGAAARAARSGLTAPAQISREAVIALRGRHRPLIGRGRRRAGRAGDPRANGRRVAILVELAGHPLGLIELLAQLREVCLDIRVGAEVRQSEAARGPALDLLERSPP